MAESGGKCGCSNDTMKAVVRELARELLEEQEKLLRKLAAETAEETLTKFHKRYGLESDHWVFLKQSYTLHNSNASTVRKIIFSVVLTAILTVTGSALWQMVINAHAK